MSRVWDRFRPPFAGQCCFNMVFAHGSAVILSRTSGCAGFGRHLWPQPVGSSSGSPLFRLSCCSFFGRFWPEPADWPAVFSARLLHFWGRLWPMPAGSCFGLPLFRLGWSAAALGPSFGSFLAQACRFFFRLAVLPARLRSISGPRLPVLVVARRFFGSSAAALRRLWPTFADYLLGSPRFRLVCCSV